MIFNCFKEGSKFIYYHKKIKGINIGTQPNFNNMIIDDQRTPFSIKML